MELVLDNDDLSQSIHEYLRVKENIGHGYMGISSIVHLRRYAVDFIAVMCEKCYVNRTAQHLAVAIFDRFSDSLNIAPDQLQMLLVASLSLACKIEEREDRIPTLSFLNKTFNCNLKGADYLRMEIKILTLLNWDICMPTAQHFKYHFTKAILADKKQVMKPSCYKSTLQSLNRFVNYFLEVSLQDESFVYCRSSKIMASCIAASRFVLQIQPIWSEQLVTTTFYFHHQLHQQVSILLKAYDNDRKNLLLTSDDDKKNINDKIIKTTLLTNLY